MPVYQGFQSILNGALGEFQSKGFRLAQQGGHTVILFYQDKRLAAYNRMGLIIPAVRQACQEHLKKLEEE